MIEVISIYSIPVQFFPSPEKPLPHWQLYEPGVLVQFALMLQSFVDSLEHSSISGNEEIRINQLYYKPAERDSVKVQFTLASFAR